MCFYDRKFMIDISLSCKYYEKNDTFVTNMLLSNCYDIIVNHIFISCSIDRNMSCSVNIFLIIFKT